LIRDDGQQIGIVHIDDAREAANERGMDLVEVAPNARPPVVKMMDYGKHRYESQRAARDARKKQHVIRIKEVKFRPGIENHDYDFKVGHARRFLADGNKVKLTMMFRGRQIAHPEIGLAVLERVVRDLDDLAKVETRPGMSGRLMSIFCWMSLASSRKSVEVVRPHPGHAVTAGRKRRIPSACRMSWQSLTSLARSPPTSGVRLDRIVSPMPAEWFEKDDDSDEYLF